MQVVHLRRTPGLVLGVPILMSLVILAAKCIRPVAKHGCAVVMFCGIALGNAGGSCVCAAGMHAWISCKP